MAALDWMLIQLLAMAYRQDGLAYGKRMSATSGLGIARLRGRWMLSRATPSDSADCDPTLLRVDPRKIPPGMLAEGQRLRHSSAMFVGRNHVDRSLHDSRT